MATVSNLSAKFVFTVAGSPVGFANPKFTPVLSLARDPSIYEVAVAESGTATLWDGAPLGTEFDVIALVSTTDCDVQFVVNGGEADESHFTLPLRGGGFPLVFWGGESYTGQTGTEDAFTNGSLEPITSITVLNRDDTNPGVVAVLLGQEAEE